MMKRKTTTRTTEYIEWDNKYLQGRVGVSHVDNCYEIFIYELGMDTGQSAVMSTKDKNVVKALIEGLKEIIK